MEQVQQGFRKIALIAIFALLIVLSFFLLRPVMISIIAGLLLAYIFMPFKKIVQKYVKNNTLSVIIVSIITFVIILLPLWLALPLIIQQVFEIFRLVQSVNLQDFVNAIIPTASSQISAQIAIAAGSFTSKVASVLLNSMTGFLINLPTILLHLFLVVFIFFFTLRDSEKLKAFIADLSPFAKSREEILVKQFKDITDSIIYGQVVVGIFQGILTGIGLFVFMIPNTLFLTLLATIFAIIPTIGPSLVWIPVVIYLFIKGKTIVAIAFLIYNLAIVSTAENIIRLYIISHKTNISSVIVLVGMIGGLFIFGLLGLIFGPLILAYLLMFLRAYKDKTLDTILAK